MIGTVLLTGATGFVGRQILLKLQECDVSTHVIFRKGQESSFKKSNNIEKMIATEDVFSESPNWWRKVLFGIDTVIHAAWYTESGKYLHSEKNLDCLVGTLQLAKAAREAGVRRFVGIGTCFEYNLSAENLSVETPLRPLTPYASAKAATFLALSQCLPLHGVEFVWCRLFYLYGDGEDSRRLVPYIRSKLASGEIAELTSGNQIRDFLDVRIAAERIVKEAMSNSQGAINICSGIPITVRNLAEQIADEYGRRDLLKFGSRPENIFDPPRVVGINN